MIAQFGEKRRDPVRINEVPLDLVRAFLAAEDDNFRDHVGIDPLGLARAAWQLVSSGQIQSGGSTITMQVAKNYFLSHERTFARKFRESLLALEIEKSLTKDEILELYFNVIFLGHRAYGVNAASQIYYGKTPHLMLLKKRAVSHWKSLMIVPTPMVSVYSRPFTANNKNLLKMPSSED